MRRNFLPLALGLMLAGCATTPAPFERPAGTFPAEGLIVQRVVLSLYSRQFALNAYAALSPTGGRRLIITETFGTVLADVLVKPDGKVFILKSSRLFPEKYLRKLVVPDIGCVFGSAPTTHCPVTMPEPNHYLITHGPCKVDLRIVETKPGAQSAKMFDETQAQ
jgi:hypothetical protein